MERADSKRPLGTPAYVALFAGAMAVLLICASAAGATARHRTAPVVVTQSGAARGLNADGIKIFRGLPYAAPPTGRWRWRAPRPPATWGGVRDATKFGASCPQPASSFPPAPISENCLYLNISTPTLRPNARRPVLVWIHGGGLTQDGGRDYDGSGLASDGIVVVTINYRLGALGFLAHPALASGRLGSAGNYGLMDQQAALRWVRRNIIHFGGNPKNVTIAGESAGGESVLAHLVSRASRGLFERAIVQSGAFEMSQPSLARAETNGKAFAARAGCPGQTAACLRHLPVAALVANWPSSAPDTLDVDGRVLNESVAGALTHGRFAKVPILNGTNHDEERIFVSLGVAVSGGSFVPVPEPVTTTTYRDDIGAVIGATPAQVRAIVKTYPLGAYPSPQAAFSTLVSDANFVCPAVAVDRAVVRKAPTFVYQFDDDNAPQQFTPPGLVPHVATHGSELQYLFGLPNAPFPGTFTAAQQQLAASMQRAWANFAASGNPSSSSFTWPTFGAQAHAVSLDTPQLKLEEGFAARHHCGFWNAR